MLMTLQVRGGCFTHSLYDRFEDSVRLYSVCMLQSTNMQSWKIIIVIIFETTSRPRLKMSERITTLIYICIYIKTIIKCLSVKVASLVFKCLVTKRLVYLYFANCNGTVVALFLNYAANVMFLVARRSLFR